MNAASSTSASPISDDPPPAPATSRTPSAPYPNPSKPPAPPLPPPLAPPPRPPTPPARAARDPEPGPAPRPGAAAPAGQRHQRDERGHRTADQRAVADARHVHADVLDPDDRGVEEDAPPRHAPRQRRTQ